MTSSRNRRSGGINNENRHDENLTLRQGIEDPMLDHIAPIEPDEARSAAKVMAGVAVEKGAKSVTHDNELDPCGLDTVLAALFGEERSLASKDPTSGEQTST